MSVSTILSPGRENAIKRDELSALLGIDERSLRRQIQKERKAGALIMSDCKHGYFLPSSEDDVKRFIKSMSKRAREIADIGYMAEKTLAEMQGQQTVDGWF